MIKIKLFNISNEIIGFEVKGHSLFINKEKEIVCASISALSQTTLLGLINYLNLDCDYKIKKGFLYFKINNYSILDDVTKTNIQTLLNSTVLGFRNISENYPNHISISFSNNFAPTEINGCTS